MSNTYRFVVFSVIGSITLMPLLVLPAMVGILVDTGSMSDSSAGWGAALGSFAAAIVGFALSLKIHGADLRKAARISLSLGILADLASAFAVGDNAGFFAARIFSGFGLGAAYVAALSAFSREDDYDRGFGIFVTLQFIVSGVGLYLIPVYSDVLQAKGLFLMFAFLNTIALCLTGFLPSDKDTTQTTSTSLSEIRILLTRAAMLAVLGYMVFEAANNAQFAYVERFGVDLSLSHNEIGVSLLIASLVGIPGAFSIVLMGQRFGTVGPLALGIGLSCLGLFVLINSSTYSGYFFGSCLLGFAWAFSLPFIQTLLASIDRQGSVIAAGSSLATFGSALGPAAAAEVVRGGNYVGVFVLSICFFVAAIVIFSLAARFTHRFDSA